MENHTQDRFALFIDGNSLFTAAKLLEFEVDYRKLLDYFGGLEGRFVRAFYYTALLEQEHIPIRPLIDWLDYNGYNVVTKPAKEFVDREGRRKIKNNMNVEITVDMLQMAPHLDHLLLFSGDGDLRRAVAATQKMGARVTVVSTAESAPPIIADDLRRQADQFLELHGISGDIRREGHSNAPRHAGQDSLPQRYTSSSS